MKKNPFISELKNTPEIPVLKIEFEAEVHSVSPGQYVVLYKDEICLGGGRIHCGDGRYFQRYFDDQGVYRYKDRLITPEEKAERERLERMQKKAYFKSKLR